MYQPPQQPAPSDVNECRRPKMAAGTLSRTFVVRSPHMTGEDVRDFQRALNRRFAAWNIGRRVAEDNDYGKDTREAARQVCEGLGIVPATAMQGGVSPALRSKIRNPKRRTQAEVARSKGPAARAFRAKLRKEFKGVGKVTWRPAPTFRAGRSSR
jgi:hypothetical protein